MLGRLGDRGEMRYVRKRGRGRWVCENLVCIEVGLLSVVAEGWEVASIGTRRSGLALASARKVGEKDHILSLLLGEVGVDGLELGERNHCAMAGMNEVKHPRGKTQGESW